MPDNQIVIDGRIIGPSLPPYIVAEISANHNGDIGRVLQLIDMAKDCGADAVKIQTYMAETMTIDCDNKDFQIKGGLWDGYNLFQLYKWAQTPFDWHKEIFAHARKVGITIFSTPFDETAVDLLEDLNCPAYKIASFEAIDLPLIKHVAKTKKPIIISTGMANNDEIHEAVETARENGCEQLVLLHCISSYPAPAEQSNLRTIPDLMKRFDVVAGLSDHTLGTAVSVSSVVLGACLIEKHVTMSREDKGPDSEFSLEPEEFSKLVSECHIAQMALGTPKYTLQSSEKDMLQFRRSLYVVEDIKAGEMITKKNIRSIRPGYGMPPKYYNDVLGKTVKEDMKRGDALNKEMIIWNQKE